MLHVLGEALMDCIAQPDGSLAPVAGGSPFNLACAAALQGADVGWLTPLSTDAFGQRLLARLRECGARPMSPPTQLPTSLAVVHLEGGEPSYGFYREGVADRDYTIDGIVRLLDAQAPGVLHTGSLMAVPPEHEKVLAIVRRARAAGWTISVDLNLRPRLAGDLGAYVGAVRELAALAHWMKASDEDLALLGGGTPRLEDAPALAREWTSLGCRRVALTFGAAGAYLQVGESQASGCAPRVEVVDTVGAGDTFWGACLADWIDETARTAADAQVRAASRVAHTLARAMHAAAINCTRRGCMPPTLDEIRHVGNTPTPRELRPGR